jgi:hypothetical protein
MSEDYRAHALTPVQEAALKQLLAGDGDPLEMARVLRPAVQARGLRLLARGFDRYPPLKTVPARTMLRFIQPTVGLLQLSNPDAIAAVEDRRVFVLAGALVGHWAWERFANEDRQRGEEFQATAIAALEAGEPLSAVDRLANELLDQRKGDQRRLECERIWRESHWTLWHTVSWIAYRTPEMLLRIQDEHALKAIRRVYTNLPLTESRSEDRDPENSLRKALLCDALAPIDADTWTTMSRDRWFVKGQVNRDALFDPKRVHRAFPGSGYAEAEAEATEAVSHSAIEVDKAGAITQRPVPSGGRPTDKEIVLAEARRQLQEPKSLPQRRAAWAKKLNKWLGNQQNVIRDHKGEVTKWKTIDGWTELKDLWTEFKAARSKK